MGLGKQYGIGRIERYSTLRDTLARSLRRPFQWSEAGASQEKFWALHDVAFSVNRGEALGIVGRNGSGKSTLLKILAHITEPTEGRARIRGRVGSLLEVGTGFHQELTGRENTFLNGAILGMRREEIRRKLDQIVAFSEVGRFLDTPVKRYSSGMYLRLAFAVAAHLETEVLLVDEVLAVGDAAFQQKCLGKMGEVSRQDRTIIFVSHNMSAIDQLCSRALWIDQGQLRKEGETGRVIGTYLESGSNGCAEWVNEGAGAEARIERVRMLDSRCRPQNIFPFDHGFRVELRYSVKEPLRSLDMLVRLTDAAGQTLWTSWDTDTTSWNGRVREAGDYVSACTMPPSLLKPGRYFVTVGALLDRRRLIDHHEHVLAFDVSEVGYPLNPGRQGAFTPVLQWSVEPQNGLRVQ